MKMESVKVVSFSPTGTTQAIVRSIASGMHPDAMELIDITQPDARKKPLRISGNEMLVVGVPVYMGRVPALLTEWLNTIQAHGTPTVCVVVYGNRAYEDALLELKNIVMACGCIPVACAAYIGEHSFSTAETPTAHGRPDADDLSHAEEFGRKVREKMLSLPSISHIPDVEVPGMYPSEKSSTLWNVDFIEVSDQCAHCGTCADVCPVSAIDPQKSAEIDQEACITCCACIKLCPQNARTMKPGPVHDARKRLNTLYATPKMPELFF